MTPAYVVVCRGDVSVYWPNQLGWNGELEERVREGQQLATRGELWLLFFRFSLSLLGLIFVSIAKKKNFGDSKPIATIYLSLEFFDCIKEGKKYSRTQAKFQTNS